MSYNLMDLERNKYLITFADISNHPSKSLNDALTVIGEICGKITSFGYKQYLEEEYSKEIANGRMKSDEKKKKEEKEMKQFKKVKTAFNNNLTSARKIIDNIKDIDELQNTLDAIVKLNVEQGTKESIDLVSQAKKLSSSLTTYRKKLERQASKSLKKVYKTHFSLMSYGRKMPKYEQLQTKETNFVFQVLKDSSTIISISSKVRDYEELQKKIESKNQKTEKSYKIKQEEAETQLRDLFATLQNVELLLGDIEDKKFKTDVRTETKSIRRVVKPKTMSITSENLEKLKNSEELKESVELIQESLGYKYISSLTRIGAKLSKRLDKLKSSIKKVIDVEKEKTETLEAQQRKIAETVRFSSDAANAYKNVAIEKARQEKIDKKTSIENDEIRQKKVDLGMELHGLESRHGQEYVAYTEVKGGDVYERREKIDNSEKIAETKKKIDALEEKIAQKNAIRDEIKSKNVSIPERYKNMKKKLEEMSKLKEASKQLKKYKGGLAI